MAADKEFARQVRNGLANLYDPTRLEVHPLLDLLSIDQSHGRARSQILREILVDAVEALRPGRDVPFSDPAWYGYRILKQRYLDAQHPNVVAHDLGMSRTTFYRHLAEAVEATALFIWDRHGIDAEQADELEEFSVDHSRAAREEALSAARSSKLELVDVVGQTHRVAEMLSPLLDQEHVYITIDAAADLPPVQASPMVLGQILLNAISEAVGLVSGDMLRVSVRRSELAVLWEIGPLRCVDDDGQVVEKCEPLALSQALVQVYGGQLWIERRPDAAAEICFEIPLPRRVSVLVVEDDPDMARLYQRYLTAGQYVVRTATDLELVRRCVKDSPPDLVLLDVFMPNNDGWQILTWLRSEPETSRVPIVVCSVLEQPDLALALGAQAVLQKPVTQMDLLETARRLVERE
ncbi:MAG: response regulator [Anaerolineae bacterium]|jgi:CheY-like chemotaxis protein